MERGKSGRVREEAHRRRETDSVRRSSIARGHSGVAELRKKEPLSYFWLFGTFTVADFDDVFPTPSVQVSVIV